MNSFNHYAYGAVIDWVYTKAAGIQNAAGSVGYKKIRFEPISNEQLDWLEVSLESRSGLIQSGWRKQDKYWRFTITTPVEADIVINQETHRVKPGRYTFFTERNI